MNLYESIVKDHLFNIIICVKKLLKNLYHYSITNKVFSHKYNKINKITIIYHKYIREVRIKI